MTRTEKAKKINEANRAAAVNAHKKPTPGIDSGASGKSYEGRVKFYCGCFRSPRICTAEGYVDMIKKVHGVEKKFEIKCNALEIARIDSNGIEYNNIGIKNDYIIYAPEMDEFTAVEKQSYVIDAELFITLLRENNCVRYKATTPMTKAKKAGELWYYDRLTIQNNSMKKMNTIYDILEEYGMTLKDFAAWAGWTTYDINEYAGL